MTAEKRSRMMATIRGKDTAVELAVRRQLHALGYRFRLHRGDLSGRPDIVLPRFRVAVFVHGCFWHRHRGCGYAATPKTRADFWQAKFEANVRRDALAVESLARAGWRVAILWECAIGPDGLEAANLARFRAWLEGQAAAPATSLLEIP
nr:very short patch repair endonuclease [Thiomonas sp. FB-Cd]